jgi:hypothetical protein
MIDARQTDHGCHRTGHIYKLTITRKQHMTLMRGYAVAPPLSKLHIDTICIWYLPYIRPYIIEKVRRGPCKCRPEGLGHRSRCSAYIWVQLCCDISSVHKSALSLSMCGQFH